MAGKKTDKNLREITCKVCGEKFIGHYEKEFCSEKCYKIRIKERLHSPTGIILKCVICGNQFPETFHHRYNKVSDTCSKECEKLYKCKVRNKNGILVTLEDIERAVVESKSQPSSRALAELLGISHTALLSRVKEKYNDYRTMVRELRGTYLNSTRNGTGNTANMLFDELDRMGFNGEREKTFEGMVSPVTGVPLRVDYYIKELPLAIEYHGKQHYEYIPYYHDIREGSYETMIANDNAKKEFLRKSGIPLIVWRYDEPIDRELIYERFGRYGNTEPKPS